MSDGRLTIWTIGHSTRSLAELVELLGQVPIDLLADIRSVPRSRTNPQFNADVLPAGLAEHEVVYRHIAGLGGLRGRRKDAPPSPNPLWRSAAFRNYADYAAENPAFRRGLAELIGLARDHRVAIMCAEAVWWRCHRRIVADYLMASGVAVMHIMGPHKIEPASPTPGAQALHDGTILYPAPPGAQLPLL